MPFLSVLNMFTTMTTVFPPYFFHLDCERPLFVKAPGNNTALSRSPCIQQSGQARSFSECQVSDKGTRQKSCLVALTSSTRNISLSLFENSLVTLHMSACTL